MWLEFLEDAFLDSIRILPFLLVIYFLVELLEQGAGSRWNAVLRKNRKFGPVIGGLFGVIPQCGFSASASELFSKRIISVGTLVAIFMSTSDEMLPIMISESVPVLSIIKIIGLKVVIAVATGYLVDMLSRKLLKQEENTAVPEEKKRAFDRKELILDVLKRSGEVFGFIFLFNLILNILIGLIGEETIAAAFTSVPVIGELIAALIGMIPNCASSVVITELYISGIIPSGMLFAGLLANSGVGMLVLLKSSRNKKEVLTIALTVFTASVLWGLLIEAVGIVF